MRRRFVTAIAILAVAHVYIWWRLVLPLPAPYWQVATAALAILGPSFPLTLRISRRMTRERAKPWLLVGYFWFAIATYLLLGAWAAHIAVAFGAPARDAALIAGGAAIGVVVLGALNVARGPVVKGVEVPLAGLAAPYRIAHLTDVHIGPTIGVEFAEVLVRRVNAIEADAIVITGDLIDGRLSELQPHIEPLRGLRARDGVYCVTGNHEYYWNVDPWLDHLRSLGIRVLRNEHVSLDGGALQLAGVDDSTMTEDVPRAVEGRDPAKPLVLLAHHPRTIARAMKAGVDLQLSGHTHGGQMLPLGWLARLFDPKVAGLARFGATWLYVSEGTGFWGPPVRVGTRCEIAAITLTPA